jgi:hypothetical protein
MAVSRPASPISGCTANQSSGASMVSLLQPLSTQAAPFAPSLISSRTLKYRHVLSFAANLQFSSLSPCSRMLCFPLPFPPPRNTRPLLSSITVPCPAPPRVLVSTPFLRSGFFVGSTGTLEYVRYLSHRAVRLSVCPMFALSVLRYAFPLPCLAPCSGILGPSSFLSRSSHGPPPPTSSLA